MLNMSYVCGKLVKYIKNGFTLLEIAEEFEKRLKYVKNGKNMWEMAEVFEKTLK